MDTSEFQRLMQTLETIKGLLAYQVSRSQDTVEAQAVALSAAGMAPKEIAAILGIKANNVSVRLAAAKRKNRSKR